MEYEILLYIIILFWIRFLSFSYFTYVPPLFFPLPSIMYHIATYQHYVVILSPNLIGKNKIKVFKANTLIQKITKYYACFSIHEFLEYGPT
jgi:hypothetical protein